VLWEEPEPDLARVFTGDFNQDRRHEILVLRGDGSLRVRNGQGALLWEAGPEDGRERATLTFWPALAPGPLLIWPFETTLRVCNPRGEVLVLLDAPLATQELSYEARALAVRLHPSDPAALVSLVRFRPGKARAVLFVHDANGDLKYLQVLPFNADCLLPAPDIRGGQSRLLLRGSGRAMVLEAPEPREARLDPSAVYGVFLRGARSQGRAWLGLGVDNTARPRERSWFDFTLHLTGSEEDLAQVGCVLYVLHPTFPDPCRLVCQRGEGPEAFAASRSAYGTFGMRVEVFLKDGRSLVLPHHLHR
jgi:hypothetical protein